MKISKIYLLLLLLLLIYKESEAQKYYATTYLGGATVSVGTIIEYNASTGTITRKVDFADYGCNYSYCDLLLYNSKFYGVVSGTQQGDGAVFMYDPFVNTFTLLVHFNSATTGFDPRGSLRLYNNKFYGTTFSGGANNLGTIFEYDPATNTLTKKFDFSNSNGGNPYGAMTLYNNIFYGMARNNGANNRGVIFQWNPSTNVFAKKFDFNNAGQGGSAPLGYMTMYNNKFYGLTSQGGAGGGVIFEWDPSTNTFVKKMNLGDTLGRDPKGSMILVNNKLYGMTSMGSTSSFNKGVLFEYDPATNTYTKKHQFNGTGAYPEGNLLYDNNKFYGMTTKGGGVADAGTVFEYDLPTNTLTYKGNIDPYGKQPLGAFTRLPYMSDIDIKGNNISIADGDNTPNSADLTDFGTLSFPAGTVKRFTIKNYGDYGVNIWNAAISGADASSFSINSYYAYVGPGDSGYLYIRFSPTSAGQKTATINLSTDDPDEFNYDFAITANGIAADRGLVYDGNDVINLAANPVWNFDSGTIEFWAKPTNAANGFRYIMINSDGSFTRWSIYLNYDRQGITFWNGTQTVSWSYNLTQNKWNHFAFVQSGNSLLCYINGLALGGQTISPASVNGRPMYIGNIPGSGQGFIGSMDEIRFWSTQRTQSEINANMVNDVSQQSGLVAYYRFDQGIIDGNNTGLNYALDFSGNCRKGTLNNFSLTGSTSNWTTGAAVNVNTIGFAGANVKGNGINITDGATAPLIADNTDFGNTSTSGIITKTFTIENNGTGSMLLSSIAMSGTEAALFTVENFTPNTNVAAGQSTTFKVIFTPTAAGLRTATVTINTNDCDHAAYDFAIQANAFTADRGLSFNGTNSYLNRSYTPSYQLSTATWEMWMKASYDSVGYNPGLMSVSGSIPLTTQWGIQISGTRQSIIFTSGASSQSWNYSFEKNQWYHVAFVSLGGNTEAFVNGASLGTKVIAPVNNNSVPFYIGQSGVTGQSNYFFGWLDDVRIWNVARTPAQIQSNMNSDIPQQTGLIGYYKFDQGVAGGSNAGITEANDYSSNCNILTLNNFALTGTVSNFVNGATISSNPVNFPEIDIRGNGISIADGDNTSNIIDGTNFGNSSNNGIVINTFKIHNTGAASLSITGATMSGADAGMFTMQAITPASPVPPNDSATFTVTFAPTSAGVKNATLTLNNSDCNEGSYDFAISGTGIIPERGLTFDGVDDRVQRNSNGSVFEFGANATWELWMKKTFASAAGNPVLVANRNTNTTRWSCQLTSNGQALGFWNGSSFATWSYAFNQNQWYHVAFVQTGSSMETFVNGVSLGVQSITSSSQTNLPLMMGSNGTGEYFKGTLDEIRIWNVARTPAQIQANMNSDVAQQSGLVAYYRFDQGIAGGNNAGLTELQDYSGNCYSAALNGFSLNGTTSNWTAGGVASTVAINFPDANVQGNGNNIIDGSTTPSLTNHTDFGTVLTGSNLVRTYTIQNTGAQSLTINSITKTGADVSMFTIGALTPSGPIAPSGSATFSVTFTPASAGLKTVNISVSNNDCDEGAYDFAIQGTGATSSFINITVIPEGFYDVSVEKLNMRDTVKAYLHSNVTPFNVVDSAIAVIDSNTFTGSFQFLNAVSGTYYIRLKHRNTLETWSKTGGETFTLGTTMSYNFTNAATQAFGSNMKNVDNTPARYAIYSGEINSDGTIDVSDLVGIYNDQLILQSGYTVTDLNADYFVDVSDLIIAYNNSINVVTAVTP